MIDYRKWRHNRVPRHEHEPSVLTPMQRNVFWLIYSGQKLANIASDLYVSLRTVVAHKQAIEERIPGLDSFSAYGALGSKILSELPPQVNLPAPKTKEVIDA